MLRRKRDDLLAARALLLRMLLTRKYKNCNTAYRAFIEGHMYMKKIRFTRLYSYLNLNSPIFARSRNERIIALQIVKMYLLQDSQTHTSDIIRWFGIDYDLLKRTAEETSFLGNIVLMLSACKEEYGLPCYSNLLNLQYILLIERAIFKNTAPTQHK